MTEAIAAPKIRELPNGITETALVVDDVLFEPRSNGTQERATRAGVYLGDVLHDASQFWFVRKVDPRGELSDWKEMRCVHEARALLVSKIRFA